MFIEAHIKIGQDDYTKIHINCAQIIYIQETPSGRALIHFFPAAIDRPLEVKESAQELFARMHL
jgi:hypothetical protein